MNKPADKDMLAAIAKVLVHQTYKKDRKYFQREQYPDDKRKLVALEHLCQKGVLDLPIQGLMHDWIGLPVAMLETVLKSGRDYSNCYRKESDITEGGFCHALTAFHWVMNQQYQMVRGFADKSFDHSWLYDPKADCIIEPTPIKRNIYFGYVVINPIDTVIINCYAIRDLIKAGTIDVETVERYNAAAEKLSDCLPLF